MISIADLLERSIEIITSNQHETGSYVASPNFSIYNYCWLKDGAFTAHAMDVWNENDSSRQFFNWSDSVISKQASKLKTIIDMKKKGDILLNDDYLPIKFMLDGNECNDDWPNFQLDGYGTWLWALAEHLRFSVNQDIITNYKNSIRVAVDYLINFWDYPCFDCWQENDEKIHTSTLTSIYGGLKAINEYINDEKIETTTKEIKKYVLEHCVIDGRLKKCTDEENIDGSLLWAAIPFKLFNIDDSIIKETVKEIEGKLVHGSGVHRYLGDTYYGGGEWIVLSASLGLYYCEAKEINKAKEILNWIERKANENGELSEQILEHVNDVCYINKWKSLWGEVASPVLWAQAMYLILLYKIKKSS